MRPLWIVRLILYPALAGLVALLLMGGGDDEPAWLTGRTQQGQAIELLLEDGQASHLQSAFDTRCPAGADHVRVFRVGPFPVDDGRLKIRETTRHRYRFHDQTSRRVVSIDARVDDGAVSGTATVVEHFDGPDWGAYVCESGAVTFSAR